MGQLNTAGDSDDGANRSAAGDSGFATDVVVIGGAGHVGLPLAIALADSGARTVIFDTNAETVAAVNRAELPFDEPGADHALKATVASGVLHAVNLLPFLVLGAAGILRFGLRGRELLAPTA